MAEKRKHIHGERTASRGDTPKKQKRGFSVGPANLPDGTYRRKTQKIKEALIERAQIKKAYTRLKKQSQISDVHESIPQPASLAAEAQQDREDDRPVASTTPHPDRQHLMDQEPTSPETADEETSRAEPRHRKQRKPKTIPFQREYQESQKRKVEAEERRNLWQEAQAQRKQKLEERDRFRKAMAKAHTGGPNGQRKLGRESHILLERVKRMVGNG